jgi:hypothetical protein
LSYADDINIVAENIHTTKKNTEALLDGSKDVGLEVNPENTMYMLMSYYQKAGRKHGIMIANRFFENVAEFKYLGTLTDQNCVREEIMSKLNVGDACYHLVQSLSSSSLSSKNIKVKM